MHRYHDFSVITEIETSHLLTETCIKSYVFISTRKIMLFFKCQLRLEPAKQYSPQLLINEVVNHNVTILKCFKFDQWNHPFLPNLYAST